MGQYSYKNLNPYKNTIYLEFYKSLFEGSKCNYGFCEFPTDNCTTSGKIAFLPLPFLKIICLPEMQATTEKLQVSNVNKNNPRMNHNRYEHMLHAFMVGVDLLIILEKNGCKIDNKSKIIFLIRLLTHDIGHGPTSHPFEEMIGQLGMHEEIGMRFFKENQAFRDILNSIYDNLADDIIDFNVNDKTGLHELIENQFDLDRVAFLILDMFTCNYDVHKTNSIDNVEMLIESIYGIFESIVLKEGHVYYKRSCLPDMERFLQARVYNYNNLYNAPHQVLDNLIQKRIGDLMLAKKLDKLELDPNDKDYCFKKEIVRFTTFIREMLDKKSNIDLGEYFKYTDKDLTNAMFYLMILEDPTLTRYSRLFHSNAHEMLFAFEQNTYDSESACPTINLDSVLKKAIKITTYKNTSEEYIRFINPDGSTIDYLDCPERTLPVETKKTFFAFSEKKGIADKDAYQPLENIIIDNMRRMYKEKRSYWNYVAHSDSNNHQKLRIYKEILSFLSAIMQGTGIDDYCQQHNITRAYLNAFLMMYTPCDEWCVYAHYLSLSSEEQSIYLLAMNFTDDAMKRSFLEEIYQILEFNINTADNPAFDNKKVIPKLCITSDNSLCVYINKALLELSYELSEESRERIRNVISDYTKKLEHTQK